ncbi:TRAP-type C4-dicarboxylate transport system, substrate-binding protein [Mesobacillus persicus]|uniref:TRAP-type C4-dicarboxylate transport system, substrate-binding protein n=1 Tax=Mesobacillus persicus TaxID=930146 RepID=A0A1H8AU57_9BACI|nr:TRAP transporter substrate-binding protein DctP [Mesobacillus persicus]SEM74250.1 TRAP-type C4-dicarboxylate transport system, substrate-binding protein [Mesobacillus persicus]
MRTKKFAAFILSLGLAIVALTACGGGKETAGDGSSDPIVLRLASDAPLEHIATGLNNELAEIVKERTEGRVEIKYFPASQLGGYETVYEEIMRGTIDAGQITIPDALDARLGAAYVPYYAKNFDEAKILYAPDSYLSNQIGELTAESDVKFLGFVIEGFIGQAFVKEPTDMFTPGVNKEVKTRSPGMVTFRIPQEELGFIPITVPYAEVPTAIQTKVVDGWVGGTPNINYAWVGEVINYMYVNYLHAEATSYVMSEKTLEKLSPEDAEIVIAAFNEQSEKSFTLAQENEETYKKKLAEDYDVEVIEFTEEQIDVYADFVRETTWPKLEEQLSKELMDGMRAEIEKLKSN